MSFISGAWFEFEHHNKAEGKYWNHITREFDCLQIREKICEMKELGLEYIVLMATALYKKAYFDTDIFPKADLKCPNPIENLLTYADEFDMKVFIGNGFYGDWRRPGKNMRNKTIVAKALKAMNELAEKFTHHKSFYGWYFPDETCIVFRFGHAFVDYINLCCDEAHRICARHKTLIAPFGTNMAKPDDKYVRQLETIAIDYIAYQDEVGVKKTKVENTAKIFEGLKKAHDKAGRAKLWADIELFTFEGMTYRSALLPANIERIRHQIENVSPYVDKILAYQFTGLLNKPKTSCLAGHNSSMLLYKHLLENKNILIGEGQK